MIPPMKFDLANFVRVRSDASDDGWNPIGTYLYVIECPGHVKVGVSSIPEQRMAELQVGNPHRLLLAGSHHFESRAAAYLAEKGAHRMLQGCAAHGEWFAVSASEIRGDLDQLAFHAAALTRLRQMARARLEREYDERYHSDPAFRSDEDARRANRASIAAVKRVNREWRRNRAA